MKTNTKKIKVKKESGGKREGAGRPKGAATIIIPFRILPEWKERIKEVVRAEIALIKKDALI